jgi:hypothetical protein
MKHTIKIVILSLCAGLALSACNKRHHTPDTSDQKIPLSFTAESHDAVVKSATKAAFPENTDFGVWGVARHNTLAQPYVLWLNGMEQVTKNTDGSYVPATEAYWLKDYTYNFLAVAPFTGGPAVTTPAQPTSTSTDELEFTFDMDAKYDQKDYDFDLMAAAATSTVDASHGKGSQSLIFWHLLSKINVNVSFVDTEGTVDEIRLSNILTQTQYTLGLDQEPANASDRDSDYPLNVSYVTNQTEKNTSPIVLNADNKTGDTWTWIMHVVPQVTKDFVLYLDFTVGGVSTTNFKVNLSAAGNTVYQPNSQYNWNITINPKTITFDVSVNPWVDGDDFEFPIE